MNKIEEVGTVLSFLWFAFTQSSVLMCGQPTWTREELIFKRNLEVTVNRMSITIEYYMRKFLGDNSNFRNPLKDSYILASHHMYGCDMIEIFFVSSKIWFIAVIVVFRILF